MKIIFQTGGLLRKVFPALLICSSVFLFTDCKRTLDDENFFGPNYRVAPANFTVNSFTHSRVGVPNVNFQVISGIVRFNASLSDTVSWTITVTGQTSGATFILNGLSDTIKPSDHFWQGESSNMYFFKKGETVTVDFNALGHKPTYTVSPNITIAFPNRYHRSTNKGISYFLIDDFEAKPDTFSLTGRFKDVLDGEAFNGLSSNYVISGDFSYRMEGVDKNPNSYICGVNSEPLTNGNFFKLNQNDPSNLYLNAYIYGTGKINSAITFKVYEIDSAPLTPGAWNSPPIGGVYDQKNNDGYVYDLIVNWTGWKLVSLKYSDFKRASDPATGGNGNNIKEPLKINGIVMQLGSQPTPGKEAEIYIDYLTFTEGGVFVP